MASTRKKGTKNTQKALQEAARLILSARLPDDDERKDALDRLGVEPNGAGAVLYAQMKQAMDGDLKAASFLRDLAGQPEAETPTRKKPEGAQGMPDLSKMSDAELRQLLAET